MVEEVNGGDNSIDSKNIDLNRRAIHIHGGMEYNLAKYAKNYSYGNIEILRGSEFTRKLITIKEFFLDISKQMLEISYTLNLKHLLKIAPELERYIWQKLKPEKIQNLNRTTIDKQVSSSIPKARTTSVTINNHMIVIQV
jgi:hypothetical protein